MRISINKSTLILIILLLLPTLATAQTTNPTFTDPLLTENGEHIETLAEWQAHRTKLKELLSNYQYGHMPPVPTDFQIKNKTTQTNENHIKETFEIVIQRNQKELSVRVGVVRPKEQGEYPVIIKNGVFRFDASDIGEPNQREKYRQRSRFEICDFVIEEAIRRGYVFAKFIRTDIAPDHADNRDEGVFPLYPEYDWATIAAWAWGHSLVINYMETVDYADRDKIVVTGHSRGGKTALCAGIYDERIAITAPNSSGTGGTGSWKYFDPEHEPQVIERHVEGFPHWWHPRLYEFAGRAEELPFDAHINKALIAPRALLNTHARHDYWANPYGTWLTHKEARNVFAHFAVPNHCALHWRDGGHNQNQEDWTALFDYADMIFFGKETERKFNSAP